MEFVGHKTYDTYWIHYVAKGSVNGFLRPDSKGVSFRRARKLPQIPPKGKGKLQIPRKILSPIPRPVSVMSHQASLCPWKPMSQERYQSQTLQILVHTII